MEAAITAKAVYDLFELLSEANKEEFLRILGRNCSPKVPLFIASELSPSQRQRFTDSIFGNLVELYLPVVVREVVKRFREHPGPISDEFEKEVEAGIKDWVVKTAIVQRQLEREKLKRERDPKPRKTDRDDEIVRLRDVEGKSFGEIPRILLRKNQSWGSGEGKPITRDAVEKAYHRRKGT